MICYVISLVLVVSASQVIQAYNSTNCNSLGVLTYKELGCKPVFDAAEGCPSYYNCPKYTRSSCYCNFQGKKIELKKTVDSAIQSKTCNAGCFCGLRPNDTLATFTCAVLDCAQFFLPPPEEDCYRIYKLGQCCSTLDVACPPFDNQPTCKVDGVTYKVGEPFVPKGTCLKCVCQKGYEGKNVAPFCEERNCGFEFRNANAEKIEKNCAPAYYLRNGDTALCCPDDFICPSKNDVIKKMGTSSHTTSKSCKFGDKEIAPNEGFERSVTQFGTARNLKCICELPPYLTCTAKY